MRFTLTPKDRLVLLKGLRVMFKEFLKAKNEDAAVEIYNLAQRISKGATGRPEKVWSYWFRQDSKRYQKELSQMIASLEAKLSSSNDPEKP